MPSGSRLANASATSLHRVDRLDEIGAGALLDLDGDRRLAVEPGDRLGVLEGRADGGEVLRAHHRVRAGDDRQVGDVLDGLDQRGHLDRVAALRALEGAGRDQAVARRRRPGSAGRAAARRRTASPGR